MNTFVTVKYTYIFYCNKNKYIRSDNGALTRWRHHVDKGLHNPHSRHVKPQLVESCVCSQRACVCSVTHTRLPGVRQTADAKTLPTTSHQVCLLLLYVLATSKATYQDGRSDPSGRATRVTQRSQQGCMLEGAGSFLPQEKVCRKYRDLVAPESNV